MTATENASTGILAELSEEERRVLASAMTKVEWEIYQRVLKRLRAVVAVVASILTVFGVASLITVRSAFIDVAANRIATDADVREQVVADSTAKLQRVSEIVASADRLQHDVDEARGRALAVIRADLAQIVQMTSQIQRETANGASEGHVSAETVHEH